MNSEGALEVGSASGGEGIEGGVPGDIEGTANSQVIGCGERSVVDRNSSCTFESAIAIGKDHLIAIAGKIGNGRLLICGAEH